MTDITWIKNFYLETEIGFLGRVGGMISSENSAIVQEEQKLVPTVTDFGDMCILIIDNHKSRMLTMYKY